jgi:hypothetical protein
MSSERLGRQLFVDTAKDGYLRGIYTNTLHQEHVFVNKRKRKCRFSPRMWRKLLFLKGKEMSVPGTPVTEGVVKTPYDSSVSYHYKEAVHLGVPVRYVIIEPTTGRLSFFVEVFDLDEHPDAKFTTIFSYIRQLVEANPVMTLSQIWDNISQFQGDTFSPLELVYIWLHALPEYRIQNDAVFAQIIAFLQSVGEESPYANMAGFLEYYRDNWLPRFQADLLKDRQIVEKFTLAQEQISRIPPLNHSGIELDSIMVSYDFSFENNPLPDIFNTSFTDYVIPFIQYNIEPLKGREESEERYYKVYKGRSVDAQPNYNNIVIPPERAKRGQTIYLNIWTGSAEGEDEGELEEDARIGKKEAFLTSSISYLPDQKVVRVTIDAPYTSEVDQNTIIDRLHQHVPGLPRPPERAISENRISGSFTVYNINIIDEIFLHLVMNNPLFNTYLYVEESQKSFAVKQRLIIHYRGAISDPTGTSRAAVSATISEDRIPRGEKIIILNELGQPVQYVVPNPEGLVVIRVKMTKASSRRVANQFVNILSRLFRIYVQEGGALLNEYLRFIPDYQLVINQKMQELAGGLETVQPGQETGLESESRITQLQKYASDIFVKNYARQCQKPLQPRGISANEIPAAERRTFINRSGIAEARQVLPFPPSNPRYFFVCPNDKYPYPGVKVNKTLSNKHEYPFIPCCFQINQVSRAGSNWNLYVSGGEPRAAKTNARSSHEIKTDKSLPPGRFGFVDSMVVNFIRKYSDESGEIRRYGVPRSTNSFIHCVALGVEDPNYVNSPDREAWVSQVRTNLFNLRIRPELLRQEMFDMTNDDIIEHATNEDEFFDPLMYYRAMEELFDCNIYIFALNDKDRRTGQETSLLQLPRHKYFHVHPPVPRSKNVLIVRHWGSESDDLEYPQCELILDRLSYGIRYNFDEEMNRLLYPALAFVGRTLTWQITPERSSGTVERSPIEPDQLVARQNMYSVLNYKMIFGNIQINGQVIDSSGKARMFALLPQWGNVEHTAVSPLQVYVNVPPTAPLNVPEFRPEEIGRSLPPYERTVELFGEPVSVTTSTDGRYLTGLWFPAGDIQFAFYCPCTEFPMVDFLKSYPNINTSSELAALTVSIPRESDRPGGTSLDRIREFRRASNFIIQIVQYLYLVAGRPTDLDTFMASIAGMLPQENKVDSALIYNMRGLKRVLPEGPDVQTVLVQLSAQLPKVFPSGRLLIYDDAMRVGVRYNLWKWARDIQDLPIDISTYRELKDYYSSKQDFDVGPQEFILSSLQEYNSWSSVYVPSSNLQQRSIQNLKDNIQTKLNPNAFSYKEPYIFQKSGNTTIGTSLDPRDDRFYLIQNVTGGEFLRAIQVANTWFLEKKNTGFNTAPYSAPAAPVHVIYKISQGSSTVVETNMTNGNARFLEILNYGNPAGGGLYAAMLPIL